MNLNSRRQKSSDKHKRQFFVLGVLVSIIAFMVVARVTRVPEAAQAKTLPSQTTPDGSQAPSKPDAVESNPVPFAVTWPVKIRRDIFAERQAGIAPPVVAPSTAPSADSVRSEAKRELSLHAIVVGEPSRVIINGQPLVQGQTIAGFRIVRIDARKILVEKHGVTVEMGL